MSGRAMPEAGAISFAGLTASAVWISPLTDTRESPMPAWTPVFLPEGFPPPKGPYSPAVRAGDFIYVSGQTPRDPMTGEIVGADVATQARFTLSNVQRMLEQAGGRLSDVVSVTVYLQKMSDWATVNSVYTDYFTHPYPSRTAVGADLRDILVEINCVAYVRQES
jgi:2-iminobutanoate/2-iminopropanoate deaminase